MRLTKRIDKNVYYTAGKYPETLPAECETQDVRTILRCLAVYEDIGLEPDEIKNLLHDGGIGIAMRRRETEAENERLKSELAVAVAEIYGFATCSICAHISECEEIGGRCEGRGYGSDCMNEDTDEPHFKWRGPSIV